MGDFSNKQLLNMLSEFMICEIGSRAIDGITYAMVLKDSSKRESDNYNRYMQIKQEAIKCGFKNNEIFRTYEVANGYIFDMDLSVAKQITHEISKTVAANNGGATPVGELLKDKPDTRRKKDMIALSKYLKSEFDKGNKECNVALFSRNSTNKIIITGKAQDGTLLNARYNAYAIRHWDIEIINDKLLIPAGFRVKKIQPCEILPSKTGVVFTFTMESMKEFNGEH